MNNIILNLNNSIPDKDNASKLLVGTGKDSYSFMRCYHSGQRTLWWI